MSDGFEGCWKALETHPMVEDAESLAREAWKMGREFGKGDTVMVKPITQSQVELHAENKRLREKVKQLEADLAHHNQGWDACVVENNGIRARVEKLQEFVTSVSEAGAYSGSDMDSRREDFIDISYRDDAIDLLASLPPQTTEGE